MNGFNRFLLVLIGILGLVSVGLLVLGVYDVPRLSPLIEQWQDQQWYSYTILSLGGFLAFVFVILLFTGLLSRSKGQRLLIQTGDGNITISKQTIERTALESIRGINGVRSPRVNADIHSKKETVALEVDCSVSGQEGLPTIASGSVTRRQKRLNVSSKIREEEDHENERSTSSVSLPSTRRASRTDPRHLVLDDRFWTDIVNHRIRNNRLLDWSVAG